MATTPSLLSATIVDGRSTSSSGSSSGHRAKRKTAVRLTSNLKPGILQSDSFEDIKKLLDILHANEVPGPRLLRMRDEANEFSESVGRGGQGSVRAPSKEFAIQLNDCVEDQKLDITVRASAHFWKRCVVKQLHNGRDQARLEQINFALSEVSLLCHPKLRKSHLVRLLGWGLCLDSLENSLSSPRLPLLILERASCDLSVFIQDQDDFKTLDFDGLRSLAEDIGLGLEAIHDAKICHGDLKLDNILVFNSESGARTQSRWTAKICDFGSAKIDSVESSTKDYYGTRTWLPPEKYRKPIVIDLRLCDVFAYGLVVWAIFTANAESPISDIDRDTVREQWGTQLFYRRALAQILNRFPGIRRNEDESRNQGSNGSETMTSIAAGFIAVLDSLLAELPLTSRYQRRSVPSVQDYGPEANRVLSVLSTALNDHPKLRNPQPWSFLRRGIMAFAVQAPAAFDGKNTVIQFESHPGFLSERLVRFAGLWVPYRKQMRRMGDQFALTASFYLKTWLPILQPGVSKQRAYERFHRVFVDLLGRDPDDLDHVLHLDGNQCRQLSPTNAAKLKALIQKSSLGDKNRLFAKYSSSDEHVLYALARIRSRFLPCCWMNILADSGLEDTVASALDHVQRTRCDELAAWALRGKSTAHEENYLDVDDSYFDFIFGSGITGHHTEHDDSCMTERLLVLLDSDVFLGQNCGHGANILPEVTQRQCHALHLCQHFRRVAGMDEAALHARLFYLGSIAPLDGDTIGIDDSNAAPWTTTLHDAVRAGCYEVVQYLIVIGFNVAARDADDKTATDIALDQLVFRRDNREQREILDLLLQHPSNKNRRFQELPLGWESFSGPDSVTGYRETSVSHEIDPITFKEPKVSLLQDRLLALAERKVRGNNSSEVYFLNPIRFLKSTVDENGELLPPAVDKEHNDDWFHHEIKRTREPSIEGITDDRRWYRVTAKLISYVVSFVRAFVFDINIFLVFIPLCIASNVYDWGPKAGIAFGILSTSILLHKVSHYNFLLSSALFQNSDWILDLTVVASLLSNMILGTLAVCRGDTSLPVSLLTGHVVCNSLLIFGTAIIVGGLRFHELLFYMVPAQTMSDIGSVGPWISILLSAFSSGELLLRPVIQKGILLVSRAAAIFCLIATVGLYYFRFHSHDVYFNIDDTNSPIFYSFNWIADQGDDNDVSQTTKPVSGNDVNALLLPQHTTNSSNHSGTTTTRLFITTRKLVLPLIIFATLLFIVTIMLSKNIASMPTSTQQLVAIFALPLAGRFWLHAQPIHAAYDKRLKRTIDWAIGSSLKMSLIVMPIWVLIGWAIDVPLTLRFDLLSTVTYGLSFLLVATLLRRGKVEAFSGQMLVVAYSVCAFAFTLYYDNKH